MNIGGDASKLACDYGVHMAATADLSDFAKDRSRVLGELEDVTANVEYRRWSLAGEWMSGIQYCAYEVCLLHGLLS